MIKININNLKEGQTIKNYKELCEVLEIKQNTGCSKIKQMEELKLYCNYEKQGNKFIIKEIYKKPLKTEEEIKLSKMSNYKYDERFNISILDINNHGVYYILKDNDIYIGSTINSYRKRFKQHLKNDSKNMEHTQRLLKYNGTFNILHDMTNIKDEILIRMMEKEYINYIKNYTNYNLINKTNEIIFSTANKNKLKKKIIKVNKIDYEITLQLLKDNNIKTY